MEDYWGDLDTFCSCVGEGGKGGGYFFEFEIGDGDGVDGKFDCLITLEMSRGRICKIFSQRDRAGVCGGRELGK